MTANNQTLPPLAPTNQSEIVPCNELQVDALMIDFVSVFFNLCALIVVSRLLHHLLLKSLGVPILVAHMMAGAVVQRVVSLTSEDGYSHILTLASAGGCYFMFLIGLEMDFLFVKRSIRPASFVYITNTVTCTLMAVIACMILYLVVGIHDKTFVSLSILIILFANTTSPAVVLMMTELKVTMSEVGRIGISTAFINDLTTLVFLALISLYPVPGWSGLPETAYGRRLLVCTVALTFSVAAGISRVIIQCVNWFYKKQRYISDEVMYILLLSVFALSLAAERLGYHSMMATFMLGLIYPREGPTTRTMTSRMTWTIRNLVMPIYFGYAGAQMNLSLMRDKHVVLMVVTIVVLGTVGKVLAMAIAARHLKFQVQEGLVLAFLLNIKGHVQFVLATLGKEYGIWTNEVYMAILISMIINSMIGGPAAAYIVRRERRAMNYQCAGLEWLNLDSELRIMACAHFPHDIPTVLDLIQISSGIDGTPLAPYLMHLIELTGNLTNTMLYNQIQEDDLDNKMGGQNAKQINAAVDAFNIETGIKLRQLSAISRFANMHEDLCNAAKDVYASLIVLPFHRRQRFDGKMGAGKDGIREFNLNVLRHAPCTVGILVDRGLGLGGGATGGTANSVKVGEISDDETLHHVVVLFFGGPDDREGVAYGSRLAMHPCVSVTVVRFLPAVRNGSSRVYRRHKSRSSIRSSEVLEVEASDMDEDFMADFHSRFVVTGIVTYTEKVVENSAETVSLLAAMEGMYSLFIVGRQRQESTSRLTMGMSAWQECKELGEIGDLLASSDFMLHGSVLVVQQHGAYKEISASMRVMSLNQGFVDGFKI